MNGRRKSWREKMENPSLPKLVEVPARMQKRFGTGTMLIPHPQEVAALIRAVPEGGLVTPSAMRSALAEKHGAQLTCPLTTGIFVWIAAHAAEESAQAGEASITPYWRVVKDDGSLNPKFPGGVARQAARLREEGHRIVAGKGKRPPRLANMAPAGA